MARKRMIDPDAWFDEEMEGVEEGAQFFHIKTWTIACDQHATFPHKPKWLRVELMPHTPMEVALPLIEKYLFELQRVKKLFMFQHRGELYWYVKDFFKYQRIDRPSKAKSPEFNPATLVQFPGPHIVSLFSTLDEYSTSTRPELKKEVKKEDNTFFITRNPRRPGQKEELSEGVKETVEKFRLK